MRTKVLREQLLETFNIPTWERFKSYKKEAESPYPIVTDWKCTAAKGRRKNGAHCAFAELNNRNPDIDDSYVTENFTYIRFRGSPIIWRYYNPLAMRYQLKHFDTNGVFDEMEEGDIFTLEPPGKARSATYAAERLRAIRNGTWKVKKRGPNPNMMRKAAHHFRPY